MGDMSKEPSMEEILSSIKRIIAEDGDSPVAKSGKQSPKRDGDRESHRKAVVADLVREAEGNAPVSYVDEVLELTDEMPRVGRGQGAPEAEPEPALPETAQATPAAGSTIVSAESELAARSSLAALSQMMIKPEAAENTLEGLVREMLRPMLKEWLDAQLPTLVEGMVAREIARITGRPL